MIIFYGSENILRAVFLFGIRQKKLPADKIQRIPADRKKYDKKKKAAYLQPFKINVNIFVYS